MVKHTVSDPQASSRPQPASSSSAPPVDTSDVIDWDLVIETPLRRPKGTIHASLIHTGRSRPLPLNEAGISIEGANGNLAKRIVDIERIGENYEQKLSIAGIGTVEQLLERGSTSAGRSDQGTPCLVRPDHVGGSLRECGLPSSHVTAAAGALPGRNHHRHAGLADHVFRSRVSSHKAAQGMVS